MASGGANLSASITMTDHASAVLTKVRGEIQRTDAAAAKSTASSKAHALSAQGIGQSWQKAALGLGAGDPIPPLPRSLQSSPLSTSGDQILATAMARNPRLKAMEAEGDLSRNNPASQCIWELMDAVDTYIPLPERPIDKPFLMPVEDVFTITGRGTVVTGRIERGVIKTGEEVEILGLSEERRKTVCTGVEMFRKILDRGEAGDNVGLLLRGVEHDEVSRGQVVAKTGSIHPHTQFECEVYILSKEEGGRHKAFVSGYRPQFYLRTTDVTGEIKLPEGVEMAMPGDKIKMNVTLIYPVAIDDNLRFAIREGGRTIGAGVVTKIIE